MAEKDVVKLYCGDCVDMKREFLSLGLLNGNCDKCGKKLTHLDEYQYRWESA